MCVFQERLLLMNSPRNFVSIAWAVRIATAHVVARRKWRGDDLSRTFHPVPGCRRFIGWCVSGEREWGVVDRGFLFDVCCDRHNSGFDFCTVNFGAKVDRLSGRGGLRSTEPHRARRACGGMVSKIKFGWWILNFWISALGGGVPRVWLAGVWLLSVGYRRSRWGAFVEPAGSCVGFLMCVTFVKCV